MRQRLLDMAEQRNFLCDQLKALLKRNKVLEAEIQQLKNGGDLQSLSISMGSASFFRAHQNQRGYHDDHSHGSSRKAAAKQQQSMKVSQQQPQPSTRTLPRKGYQGGADTNTNSSSKVRFDPASTDPGRKGTADDAEDDDEEVDPMTLLDEEDEDDELAYLQQRLRTQQIRQTRQESARRLSVSLDADQDDDDDDVDEKSSPAYSRHSSSNRLQLPPPLQRAMASGRGDSLFNIRPASSSGPNSTSPPRSLRGSQSAIGLGAGRQPQPTRSASPPSYGGGMHHGAAHAMAQSMPALPSISAANAAKDSRNQGGMQQQPQHQPSQQELQQRHEELYKSELENLEGQRPRLEVALEESIREIFTEVRNRKKNGSLLCSTKRPTGVAFSGGSTASPTAAKSKNPWATNHPRDLPRGMQDVVQELDAQDHDIDPEPGADGARLIKMTPTITQRGGIAGLGTTQFSENDRFAAMVKYLAQPDVFEEVSKRLWTVFFPPTEEELRASGQYLGKRRGTSSAGGRTTRSPSASRAHSPSAR